MRNRLFHTESFRYAAIFTALFAGSMAVLIVVVYVILDHSFKANLLREVDDDLTSVHTSYVTAKPGRALHEAKEIIDDRLLAPDIVDVFLLQRGSEKVAGNLAPMPVRLGVFSMPLPADSRGETSERGHVVMGRGVMLSDQVYVFVGRDLQQMNRAEEGILYAFGAVLLVSLVLASVCGLLLSRTFLRRVDAITHTCRGIMAGRLSERIVASGTGSEFERLGFAINAMLDRIQTLMESLRQVSTDIAHDLRTPLTHMRHRLERARNDAATPQDYAKAVDGAVDECDKLLAIFTALLRIAQIEAGARRAEFQDFDLCQLIEHARDIYGPVMDDNGHLFHVSIGAVSHLRGDAQLLLQLISNLLDNAITHTPCGTKIVLSCGKFNGRPCLVVADNGPGISQADRQNVLRRFYRCEQSRTTSGSGLGLSLVSAVCELHEASLTLTDNNPGLRVEVAFASTPSPTSLGLAQHGREGWQTPT